MEVSAATDPEPEERCDFLSLRGASVRIALPSVLSDGEDSTDGFQRFLFTSKRGF